MRKGCPIYTAPMSFRRILWNPRWNLKTGVVLCIVVLYVWTLLIQDHTRPCAFETTNTPSVQYKRSLYNIFHRHPVQARFLTIGVTSIHRPNEDYLFATVRSLLEHTSEKDQKRIQIIVLFADQYRRNAENLMLRVGAEFEQSVQSSLLRLVVPDAEDTAFLDARLTAEKNAYNDSLPRFAWRSKQVLDFVRLWAEVPQEGGTYFMQLEDDVITRPNYLQYIEEYIKKQDANGQKWTCLEFSSLGFIGKLYKTMELESMSSFFRLFAFDHPVDYLMQYYNLLTNQNGRLLRVPALFQHIGKRSSLEGKEQLLVDPLFSWTTKLFPHHRNPTLNSTSLHLFEQHLLYSPALAYDSPDGFFWAKQVKANGFVEFQLKIPQNLNKIVVITGSQHNKSDLLEAGMLKVIDATGSLKDVDSFRGGQVIYEGPTLPNVKVVRVVATAEQQQWMLLREVVLIS